MHVEIVFPVNHGIGDELSFAGPLVSAYLGRGATISIWTFHPYLYRHKSITARDWRSERISPFYPPQCDVGLYFAIPGHTGLSIEFDRQPLVLEQCIASGWVICNADRPAYVYASEVTKALELMVPKPPWTFLPCLAKSENVLISLAGKGHSKKGLPFEFVWNTIEKIVRQLKNNRFVVIYLENEGQPPPSARIQSLHNLEVESFPFGSARATELYCSAKIIVTAEGGGYHMGFGLATPTLMVTSSQWYAKVRPHALPPINHDTVLFDANNQSNFDMDGVSTRIADWIILNVRTPID